MILIFSLITFAATFCPVMLSFRRRRSKIIKFKILQLTIL